MFKNIFRLTALGFLWNRYRLMIVSTSVLFLYFWVVSALHSDFVEFTHLDNDTEHLGMSFLVKWLAFILGFALYITINSRDRKSRQAKTQGKSGTNNQSDQLHSDYPEQQSGDGEKDPFDVIRNKDKLRSTADFVVENNKAVKRKT